jgi:hypothetical protein
LLGNYSAKVLKNNGKCKLFDEKMAS